MGFKDNDPIYIQNPLDTVPTGSSVQDDNKLILTKNALPALETRMQRYVINIDRTPTATQKSILSSSRFSVESLIGFLEDAAVQVAMRTDSQYLAELITTKAPNITGVWDFSDTIRILGGRITRDGVVRCQRVSEDQREDIQDRSGLDADAPIYTLEGGKLNVYAGLLKNPITANADCILLPTPVVKSGQATWVSATKTLTLTSGDTVDDDLHTLVDLAMAGISIPSQSGRGIIGSVDNGAQTIVLDIDDTQLPLDGTYSVAWKTPAYSMLNETMEEGVVELAAAHMLAALPEPEAALNAITRFEKIMESHGLSFFKT